MTFIKICGITRAEDAFHAVEAGADGIGFIFTNSKRRIFPENAMAVKRMLPDHVKIFAVFTDEDVETITSIVKEIDIDVIQLHGIPDPDKVRNLQSYCEVMQVVSIDEEGNFDESILEFDADYFLLDAKIDGQEGGTGKVFDWRIIPEFVNKKVFVAGGLSTDNVAGLIKTYHPFGVDANSQLENLPGMKSKEKIYAFVEAVKAAGEALRHGQIMQKKTL